MASNVVANMALSICFMFGAGAYGATPVSKQALTAAAHSVVGQSTPVGDCAQGIRISCKISLEFMWGFPKIRGTFLGGFVSRFLIMGISWVIV